MKRFSAAVTLLLVVASAGLFALSAGAAGQEGAGAAGGHSAPAAPTTATDTGAATGAVPAATDTGKKAAATAPAAPPAALFESLLSAGPVAVPTPAFGEKDAGKRASALLSSEQVNRKAWPAAGDGEEWLPGASLTWRVAQAKAGAGGAFLLDAAEKETASRAAFLLGYVRTTRWQKATIEARGTRPFALFVDGVEKGRSLKWTAKGAAPAKVAAVCALIRGKHRVLVKTISLPGRGGAPWSATISVKPGADAGPDTLALSTSPVRSFTDMAEAKNFSAIGSMALSPNGKLLAVILTEKKPGARKPLKQLLILEMPSGRRADCLDASAGMGGLKWSPGGESLAFKSRGALKRYAPATQETTAILEGVKGLGKYVWSPDGKFIYYAAAPPKPPRSKTSYILKGLYDRLTDYVETTALYAVPAAGGPSFALTETGGYAIEDFALSPDGKTIALVKRFPIDRRPWFRTEFWTIAVPSGRARRILVTSFPFENHPANLTWSPDGKRIAFTAPPDQIAARDRRSKKEHNFFETDLWMIDLAAMEQKDVKRPVLTRLSDRFDEAVEAPIFWHPTDGRIYFKAHFRTRKLLARLQVEGKSGIEYLHNAPSVVLAAAPAAGGGAVAFTGTSIDKPPALYFLDIAKKETRLVLDPNKDYMARMRLARWERYDFTDTDGWKIDGFLFYPPDFEAEKKGTKGQGGGAGGEPKKYPLVVYYYGGATPEVERFSVSYYQLLPANGYMLYVLNPVGACGYGEAFSDLHVNDQAKRAGNDILQGVERLLKDKPFIDAENVGAYGGSYGGFMTLSLVTRTSRFKAACSMYGIANIASYWGAGIWGYTYGDTAMAGSFPWNRKDIFVDRAPLFNADKVHTALLLLHGTADVNVPCVESEQMFTAMKILGKDVAYVRFPGEDHGIASTMDKYILHRRMIIEWFDKYLKGQPGAWTARWK